MNFSMEEELSKITGFKKRLYNLNDQLSVTQKYMHGLSFSVSENRTDVLAIYNQLLNNKSQPSGQAVEFSFEEKPISHSLGILDQNLAAANNLQTQLFVILKKYIEGLVGRF
jgi:hypothetical protein